MPSPLKLAVFWRRWKIVCRVLDLAPGAGPPRPGVGGPHHHPLALALWDTGVYEARMLCSFVDDPALITPAQMDRWCHDFDNWAICDTMCFNLFDRTPHAWAKVTQWSRKRNEFAKRTAFA
jgi:3-methyladenine DNA glycosylase AlkD